jgi:2-methylisocitrate lyase-like PEP mutase family enzyme
MKKATTRLRELIAQGPTVFVPGCFNAMSAKVLEAAGFPAVYMSGYGTSLSLTGQPDAGLATMSEMVLNARYIASAVRVPVIADADNGYGNAINVIRTVREYVGAGIYDHAAYPAWTRTSSSPRCRFRSWNSSPQSSVSSPASSATKR